MSDHLTPEDFFHFIEGALDGVRKIRVEHHLVTCAEYLQVLDLILLGEVPATPEEEASLRKLAQRGPEGLLSRLRARIASSERMSGATSGNGAGRQ